MAVFGSLVGPPDVLVRVGALAAAGGFVPSQPVVAWLSSVPFGGGYYNDPAFWSPYALFSDGRVVVHPWARGLVGFLSLPYDLHPSKRLYDAPSAYHTFLGAVKDLTDAECSGEVRILAGLAAEQTDEGDPVFGRAYAAYYGAIRQAFDAGLVSTSKALEKRAKDGIGVLDCYGALQALSTQQ